MFVDVFQGYHPIPITLASPIPKQINCYTRGIKVIKQFFKF